MKQSERPARECCADVPLAVSDRAQSTWGTDLVFSGTLYVFSLVSAARTSRASPTPPMMKFMADPRVIVFGAGFGGLATAAELRRAGVTALVLDRAEALGASWRQRYDRLKLNTTRWTSRLPHTPYPKGTPLYPSRDEVVAYLERFAADNALDVKLRTRVERIDREDGGWRVRTSGGDFVVPEVVVATGLDNRPYIPSWPGRERFAGPLLHSAEYRNPEPFRGRDVLVVGPGSSGLEIAFDLVEGGARSVQLSVRTTPNIILREQHFPADLPPHLLFRLPPALADRIARFVQQKTVGDLAAYGLPRPEEGIFTRLRREGKVPAIIDEEVVAAIRERRIQVVAGVASFEEDAVRLLDGTRLEVDAVIAATGYTRSLEPLVGHLDVLDERGSPRQNAEEPAAPGLRFVGFCPVPGQLGAMSHQARHVARAIARELHPHKGARPRLRRSSRVRPSSEARW